ncbi:XdhC family protein [Cupriavidus basilensis]
MNDDTLLQLEQRLIEASLPFAVTTVIRAQPPTSAWVGAQALVEADGALHGWIGGGCSRAIVIQAALEAIRSGAAQAASHQQRARGAGGGCGKPCHAVREQRAPSNCSSSRRCRRPWCWCLARRPPRWRPPCSRSAWA